jgi:catechol 2,3-dioxygenase-like lactoylglutathione lyase family enzyme
MNKKEKDKSLFSNLHHITVVVEDIQKAIEFYESLGVGPFKIHPNYENINFEERPGFYKMVKIAQMGQTELQLVQPNQQESLQKEFYQRKGQGVQHLGFVVDDIESAEARLKKLGLKVIESKRRPDGGGHAFFDTEALAGVALLVRQNPPKE